MSDPHRGAYTPPTDAPLSFDARQPVRGSRPLPMTLILSAVVLATLEGKSGLPYRIELHAIEPLEREGELVLQLMQGGTLIYSSAFSFFRGERGMALGIGCMQGPRGEHGLQLIKDATRELHGLRPKNLMVRLLCQLGYDYGCSQLRLVGNANRTVRGAAAVFPPASLSSVRCESSAPAVRRRSLSPAKMPQRSRRRPSVTAPLVPGPTWPAPPAANVLPVHPL